MSTSKLCNGCVSDCCSVYEIIQLLPADIPFTRTFTKEDQEDLETSKALHYLLTVMPADQDPSTWITRQLEKCQMT